MKALEPIKKELELFDKLKNDFIEKWNKRKR